MRARPIPIVASNGPTTGTIDTWRRMPRFMFQALTAMDPRLKRTTYKPAVAMSQPRTCKTTLTNPRTSTELPPVQRLGAQLRRPRSRLAAARQKARRARATCTRAGTTLQMRAGVCCSAFVERPPPHFPSTGTERPRQILAANLSATSVWRGTASTAPVFGLVQREWLAPSRFSTQPCRRRCRSSALRFTQRRPFLGSHHRALRAWRPRADPRE
jgi:hypothetical protein